MFHYVLVSRTELLASVSVPLDLLLPLLSLIVCIGTLLLDLLAPALIVVSMKVKGLHMK